MVDSDKGNAIVQASGDHPCSLAYDCIGTDTSPIALVNSITKASPTGSGKLTHITLLPEGVREKVSPEVEVLYTIISTAFDKDESCEPLSFCIVEIPRMLTRRFA